MAEWKTKPHERAMSFVVSCCRVASHIKYDDKSHIIFLYTNVGRSYSHQANAHLTKIKSEWYQNNTNKKWKNIKLVDLYPGLMLFSRKSSLVKWSNVHSK